MTAVAEKQTPRYEIERHPSTGRYEIFDFDTKQYLRDRNGNIRSFSSRGVARKRISRERTGNFHK